MGNNVVDVQEWRDSRGHLREVERRTAETESLLETLLATAPVGFGFFDRDFRTIHINQALAATIGRTPEQLLGLTLAEAIPTLWPIHEPLYRGVLETGEPVVNLETTADLPGDPGRDRTWLTSLYPVLVDGEVTGIGVVVVDITERKEMELALKHMSEHDSLTGIYNRRRFLGELDRALRYAARYGHQGAVLMLDIDNFKWVNDSHGHASGDRLLKTVASVLVDRLRETDAVARLGGDEFAVLMPEVTKEQALTVALQLRALLCERATGPPVEISVGISLFGEGFKAVDEVLTGADIAMYTAKEAGGNQACVYDEDNGHLVSDVKQFRAALAERRFVLHAQPIIDVRTGKLAHRELLIRMISEDGEIIPPGRFLPIAERFSLIGQLDRWVVDQALDVARREPVTVNLSASSVGDARILTAVRRAVADGLDPTHLTFEITETAVMRDYDTAMKLVTSLKELGCEIALDDFGTGFGSFTYLKNMPARYLKIDMEFVRGINDNPTDREIVRSIAEIARTLGKETIAEGVESADVLDTLAELGVDYAQGFHIGRPEPLSRSVPPSEA